MKIKLLLIACLLIFLTGCSVTNLASIRMPGTDIKKIKKFYVKKLPDDKRNIDVLIRDQLRTMGFNAVTGKANYDPDKVDAIVTYTDRWMWDLSNYMLQLTIYIKNTENQYVACAGKSYRTSLSRKSPEFMIKEVLEDIFMNENKTL